MSALLHRGELLCAYPAPSAPSISTINPATYISFRLFISSPIVELICLAFSTELAGKRSLGFACRPTLAHVVCLLTAVLERGQLIRHNPFLTWQPTVAKGVFEFPEPRFWDKIVSPCGEKLWTHPPVPAAVSAPDYSTLILAPATFTRKAEGYLCRISPFGCWPCCWSGPEN